MVSPSSPTATLLQTHRDILRKIHANRIERSSIVAPSEHKLPDLPPSPSPSPPPSSPEAHPQEQSTLDISHIPEAKRRKYEAYYPTYCWDEETIRNDLPERYSAAGEWGGNFIHGAEEEKRCEEYPRQRRLLALKSEILLSYAHRPLFLPIPPHLLSTDTAVSKPSVLPPTSQPTLPPPPFSLPPPPSPLATHLLQTIGKDVRFDSIHISPPPEMPWSEVLALPIRQISTEPGFVFLWVGKGNKEGGLEKGREALTKWGFRKCEEIVWVKTNKTRQGGPGIDPPTDSIFQNTKEHCLMGIRGTVRRATDGWFVHTNIDTDVIVWEGDSEDPHRKPREIYSLIENFCLGLRRLDLFGDESRARPGWVTAGFPSTSPSSPTPPSQPTVVAKLEAMVDTSEAIEAAATVAPKVLVQRFNRDSYPAMVTIEGKHVVPSTNGSFFLLSCPRLLSFLSLMIPLLRVL
ncbi:MT-A70-domain-containing protein [Mrakia frigida]|uniref:Kar4p n=1 Tax=Mrakia frigida TaxID=29902 RepID=UPI003FCBF465